MSEATTPETTSETIAESATEAGPAPVEAATDAVTDEPSETSAASEVEATPVEAAIDPGTDVPPEVSAASDESGQTVVESAEQPGQDAGDQAPAEDRPPMDLVAAQAAVSSALAADPLAQPEPKAVHEVAIEPEHPEGKHVLVIETDSQVRGSLAGACRTHPWLVACSASSVDLGEALLKEEAIDAIVLSLEEGPEAIDLLIRIRRGECQVDAGVPVMATIQEATAERVVQLKALGVARLLVRPFTLGDALETLENLWAPDGQPVVLPVDPTALEEQQEPADEAEAPAETAAAEASDAEGDASVAPAAASEIPPAEAVAEPVAEPA